MGNACVRCIVLIVLLTSCKGRHAPAPGGVSRSLATTDVTIFDYKFQPRSLTVSVGATVRWINKDIAPHTATRNITEEAFDSGRMVYGDIFTHTFQAAGSYAYLCFYHPGMQGEIVVR